MFRFAFPAVVLLAALAVAREGFAQPWRDGFESPQTAWQDAGGDAAYRIGQHRRIEGEAHSGQKSEWFLLETPNGSRVSLALNVGQPPVIQELSPSVWVKSNQPGAQLAVRVVLPRTMDPNTGRPVTTILFGDSYTAAGHWQQLRIEGIPALLAEQVRVLRRQVGPQLDPGEAYLDAVLLNVYAGPGQTNLWIDDLEIAGYVTVERMRTITPVNPVSSRRGQSLERLPPVQATQPQYTSPLVPPMTPRQAVRLEGSVLQINGRPILPRAIQYRGESLEFLKRIGFNAVWLQKPPTREMLDEAAKLGLWLICPPPSTTLGGENGATQIGPEYDCVLTWTLGEGLTESDLEFTQRWAVQTRAADRRGNRPLICRPVTNWYGFSRATNLLLLDRRPLGTSIELTDYAAWVRRQPLLASLGTPIWTTIQTQPNPALQQQLQLLDPSFKPSSSVSPEQIRLLAYTAVSAGTRGIVFASDSPLDSPDVETRQRAMSLELLNLELEVLEPWAAAGYFVTTADTSHKEVVGAVLRADRAKLLLPLWLSDHAQCVPSQSAVNSLKLVAPGISETSEAFELTPNGAQRLRAVRVAGGMSVVLDEFGLTSQILLANDLSIVGEIRRRSAQIGRRSAELKRELAVARYNRVRAISEQLAVRAKVPRAGNWFDSAVKSLRECDRQLAGGDSTKAAQEADRAVRAVRLVERAYWDATIQGLASPVTCPAALSFDTLPCHWRVVDRFVSGRFGPNRAVAGNFEDREEMIRAGWQYVPRHSPMIKADVEVVTQAARTGRFGLRLAIKAVDEKNKPAAFETPPIQFVSPQMLVEAGQIVCIYGWVKIPKPITDGSDGLMIVDSLSGETLAERISKTDDWQQFAMYRVAPRSGTMSVSFQLSGLGEVFIDDVAVQVIDGPTAVTQR